MIKKIIHCADIHIRNYTRHEEYGEQLNKFIEKCVEEKNDLEYNEMRILIAGDLAHSKNTISNELFVFMSEFLRQLSTICPVIVYSGNHDLLVNNTSRTDTLTALFSTAQFENVTFLDQTLGYKSGCIIDDNITWCLFSIHDNFLKPNIEETKNVQPNNFIVGLFHGSIVGSQRNNGTVVDNGLDGERFSGCDVVMAGDNHKRQEFYRGDTLIVYSGSLIQQTYGEPITQHGYVSWDIEKKSHTFVEIPNDYSLYDFEINSINDIENDNEVLKNY